MLHRVGIISSSYIKNGCPFYKKWYWMLTRCYDQKFLTKNPKYKGCYVCEEWLTFSNFRAWMETQDYEGKELDKDLLIVGNKIYCPAACIFVSKRVNLFFKRKKENDLPYGVTEVSTRPGFYKTHCNDSSGKKCYLGCTTDTKEGHKLWQKFKIVVIKDLLSKETDHKIAGRYKEALKTIENDLKENMETKSF